MPRGMAGDVEVYYESLGEGTPLVLQGHDHTPWLFGQAAVFSQRYRVLVYDRRGTGRSSSPDGDWSAADLANDLVRFLDALAIELALVIGHTVPYLDDAGRAWLEQQVTDARAGRPVIARQPESPATAGGPRGPEPHGGWPTTDPVFAASPLGRMIASTGTGLGRTPDDIARAIAVLRDWDQRPRRADLAKIKVPTLVIVGEREPRSTIEGSREWASWIPGAEFVVLPGAHHAAPREAAPAWNAAVQDFLDRNGLGGQSTR